MLCSLVEYELPYSPISSLLQSSLTVNNRGLRAADKSMRPMMIKSEQADNSHHHKPSFSSFTSNHFTPPHHKHASHLHNTTNPFVTTIRFSVENHHSKHKGQQCPSSSSTANTANQQQEIDPLVVSVLMCSSLLRIVKLKSTSLQHLKAKE